MSEGSIENLKSTEAVMKIQELIKNARTCMMMTALDTRPIPIRPMAVQKVDEKGRIYFLSAKNAEKNAELERSKEVQLAISNDGKSEYLTLYGKAEIYRDQDQIDEMYSTFTNNWFEGKEDPNITIIRFTPTNGHYWDSKHGKLIQMAGILMGAITGKQTDDSREGDLKLNSRR